jgi:enamine deaminase RidA (YjgF/YER057c/UK114 family)
MAKRKSINYPGFKHQNPIPNASRIGNIVMSSVIGGRDPQTGATPQDLAGQVVNVFKQIRLCVEAAGGTPDDIIKIEFWMKQPSTGRAALNEEWVKMFPDEAARPARHTQQLGADSPQHVSCAFTAVIGT